MQFVQFINVSRETYQNVNCINFQHNSNNNVNCMNILNCAKCSNNLKNGDTFPDRPTHPARFISLDSFIVRQSR